MPLGWTVCHNLQWHLHIVHYSPRPLCVSASCLSPFPIVSVAIWMTVFARFNRCLTLFWIDYKTLENYFVFEKHAIKLTSNTNSQTGFVQMCTLQVRFLLSPFPIVSAAVWITVLARFDLCLSISIYYIYKTLELNYFVFETFYLLPFFASVSRPQGPFNFRNANSLLKCEPIFGMQSCKLILNTNSFSECSSLRQWTLYKVFT